MRKTPLGTLRGASFLLPFAAHPQPHRNAPHQAQGTQHPAPNVVGYTNFKSVDVDYVMGGGSFINVAASGETNVFKLADLSVTGYELPHFDPTAEDGEGAWVGGCHAGDFKMQLLGPTGAPLATYLWLDYKDGLGDGGKELPPEEERDPGWYEEDAATPIADPSGADCTFSAGQSFWMSGSGLKLVSAGQVDKNVLQFKTVDVDYCGCGNGTAATVNLGAMWVTGYVAPHFDPEAEDGEGMWVGGCHAGDFKMQLLGPTGAPKATYLWLDYKDGLGDGGKELPPEEERDPGWYEEDAATPVDYDDPECDFLPGTGFWVSGSGLKLNVPSPLAETKDAE